MDKAGRVIDYCARIEGLLDRLGATGDGLGQTGRSLATEFSDDVQERLKNIAYHRDRD